MRRWLTPLIVLFFAALVQLEADHSNPSTTMMSSADQAIRITSPDGQPVTEVFTVAHPTHQAKRFLDACRDMFALDHENAIRIHAQYLTQSRAGIEQLGERRTILEWMGAEEALAEFNAIDYPTVRERTVLCLAMEPIITDATSAQEP
ncbi:MAG: hypothetical protein HQ488_02365 [Parcubacteria group bacterium]|nr:hypothetical protein [Parcubacteria group bacterium]